MTSVANEIAADVAKNYKFTDMEVGKSEIFVLRRMWNYVLRTKVKFDASHQVKWNKSPRAAAHFTWRSHISHAQRISQIPQGIYFVAPKKKARHRRAFLWRSGRDSNPRAAFDDNTISSRARYDLFDTTAYSIRCATQQRLLYQISSVCQWVKAENLVTVYLLALWHCA